MYDELGFNKKLNIKKVAFAVVVVLFLLIITMEIITTSINKHKKKVQEDSNPNSSFTDTESTISLNLSKKYELKSYTPKQNYLLEVRSPKNLNIFISKKDLIENHNLIDVVSADKKSYIEEFASYSNLSDITEITVGVNLPAYTYVFHYLDNNTKTSYYLQIIWIQAEDGYYVIDIEFPLDDLSSYSNIINDVASSFRIY